MTSNDLDAIDQKLPPALRGDAEARAAVAEALRGKEPNPADAGAAISRHLRDSARSKTGVFGPDAASTIETELRALRGTTYVTRLDTERD